MKAKLAVAALAGLFAVSFLAPLVSAMFGLQGYIYSLFAFGFILLVAAIEENRASAARLGRLRDAFPADVHGPSSRLAKVAAIALIVAMVALPAIILWLVYR